MTQEQRVVSGRFAKLVRVPLSERVRQSGKLQYEGKSSSARAKTTRLEPRAEPK